VAAAANDVKDTASARPRGSAVLRSVRGAFTNEERTLVGGETEVGKVAKTEGRYFAR